MLTSPQQHPVSAYHGLYLVPKTHRLHIPAGTTTMYKIVAASAALFLALTVG